MIVWKVIEYGSANARMDSPEDLWEDTNLFRHHRDALESFQQKQENLRHDYDIIDEVYTEGFKWFSGVGKFKLETRTLEFVLGSFDEYTEYQIIKLEPVEIIEADPLEGDVL